MSCTVTRDPHYRNGLVLGTKNSSSNARSLYNDYTSHSHIMRRMLVTPDEKGYSNSYGRETTSEMLRNIDGVKRSGDLE